MKYVSKFLFTIINSNGNTFILERDSLRPYFLTNFNLILQPIQTSSMHAIEDSTD